MVHPFCGLILLLHLYSIQHGYLMWPCFYILSYISPCLASTYYSFYSPRPFLLTPPFSYFCPFYYGFASPTLLCPLVLNFCLRRFVLSAFRPFLSLHFSLLVVYFPFHGIMRLGFDSHSLSFSLTWLGCKFIFGFLNMSVLHPPLLEGEYYTVSLQK